MPDIRLDPSPVRRGPSGRDRDLLVLALVVVAFGAGFWKVRDRPRPSLLQPRLVVEAPAKEPRFETRFLSTRRNTLAHAACLVELGDGRVRAFWYTGSREGAPDVEIHTAVFEPRRGVWDHEKVVAGPESTRRALRRYVRKVGNPAAVRAGDGRLWLFYVTVSVGGWSGASIAAVTSRDDGETWDPARRLICSPFLNLSTLVRGEPFLYADGTIGLPIYQSLLGSIAELVRVDGSGAVVDRQRLSADRHSPQPIVLVRSATDALVLMRSSGPEGPHRVGDTATHDAGLTWAPPGRLPLPNPDAALSGVVRPDGRILVALNDVEVERDALSLFDSADGGATWRKVRRLEDQVAARDQPVDDARYDRTVEALARATDSRVADARDYVESSRRFMCGERRCHFEFSYPSLIQTRSGEFHLVYTWNRAFIKHVEFNQAWLDQKADDDAHAPRH
ncbi:MAG TPA: sialidase family protein [Vicinamibacteria bacterium]|nr:sialidase family protein [Vicinamibacteria bacterium]